MVGRRWSIAGRWTGPTRSSTGSRRSRRGSASGRLGVPAGGEPEPVRAANLRWLAGYRRPYVRVEQHRRTAAGGGCASPVPLLELAGSVGDPVAVLPTLFHLLWAGALHVDLRGRCATTPWWARRCLTTAGVLRLGRPCPLRRAGLAVVASQRAVADVARPAVQSLRCPADPAGRRPTTSRCSTHWIAPVPPVLPAALAALDSGRAGHGPRRLEAHIRQVDARPDFDRTPGIRTRRRGTTPVHHC